MSNFPSLFTDLDRGFTSFGSWRPLLRQLDEVFNDAWDVRQRDMNVFAPMCDIDETEDHYVLSFDMPGVDRDQIDVELHGNQLTVRGERKDERKQKEGKTRFVERRFGKFERMVTLPDGIQMDDVDASYQDGVLTIAVPKAAEAKRQKIKISEGKSGIFKNLLGRTNKEEKTSANGQSKSHISAAS